MAKREKKPSLWDRFRQGIRIEIKSAGQLLGLLENFYILPSRRGTRENIPSEVKFLAASNAFEGYIGARRIGGR